MNTKKDSIKLVKIFTIIYLVTNIIARVLYNTITLTGSPILNIFADLIFIVPTILFTIFIFVFYGTNRTKILLPLSYIVSLLLCCLYLPSYIKSILELHNYYGSTMDVIHYGGLLLIKLANDIFLFIIYILFIVICFTKFKLLRLAKILSIIQASAYLLYVTEYVSIFIANGLFIRNRFGFIVMFTVFFSHIANIIFWNLAANKTT